MPRYGLGRDPMAGVGNAERLALMEREYELRKAQKPTTMDRLTEVGKGVAKYLTDKASYQMRIQAAQAQQAQESEQQERTEQIKIAQGKLSRGLPLSEDEAAMMDIPLNAEGFDISSGTYTPPAKKTGAQTKQYAKQLKVVGGEFIVFDPLTGERTSTGIKKDTSDKKQLRIVTDPESGDQVAIIFDPALGRGRKVRLGGGEFGGEEPEDSAASWYAPQPGKR